MILVNTRSTSTGGINKSHYRMTRARNFLRNFTERMSSNPLKLDSALGKFLPTVNKTAIGSVPVSNAKAADASRKSKLTANDFHIMNTLGSGSFGRVHLVRSKLDNKFFAMKVLKKNEIVKLRQVEHTINEKQILEELNMPFLVKMLGTFQDSNSLFIILEYIQGGELFSYLRKSGVSTFTFYY